MLNKYEPLISPKIDRTLSQDWCCASLSRRRLLETLGYLGIFTCSCCTYPLSSFAQSYGRSYCADSSPRENRTNEVPLEDYGDPAILAYLGRELQLLYEYFSASSRIYVNLNSSDAYMHEEIIVLGSKYIQQYAHQKYGLLKLSGVLAHEESHVFQTKWNMDRMLTDVKGYKVKYVEIHADYMAGAYVSWREQIKVSAPDKLIDFFFDLGDRIAGSERAHGTPEERRRAFVAGYSQRLAEDDVETTAARGLIYVRKTL